jgi:hypothetical protein
VTKPAGVTKASGGPHRGEAAQRDEQRVAVHEEVHRHERRDEQQLVGERVEQAPEVGHQVARARQVAVPVVGDRRDDEQHERGEPAPGAAVERQQGDQRRGRDARRR